MSENILEVKGLTKDYGDFVLDKLTFTVPKGVIMGLIGENGAGKSTTINCILNEISKTDGNIEIFGKDYLSEEIEIKDKIGVVFDENHFLCKGGNEMKGLLTKDFLTIKKKYGLPRVIMDIAIIIALMFILEKSGTIYISFLLIPIEIMSMIISLTTCDEQWKWGKYAVSLPVSKKQIVCSRYACAGILSLIGFVVALIVNSASYILFPQYAYGFYLFMSCASFALTLLFLAFVLPSNYSLGVNAGFATMFILIILLVVLGLWTKATNNSIMWFVVENFEVSIAIAGVSVVAICGLSFVLSNLFFRKKYI